MPRPALTLTCPGNQQFDTAVAGGDIVNYVGVAVRGGKPPYRVSYSTPSGTVFPIGTTTVWVNVVDRLCQSQQCAFDVTLVQHTAGVASTRGQASGASAVGATGVRLTAAPPAPPAGSQLMQAPNLRYLGAFMVPINPGYDFMSRGLAYNPANNSLFINSNVNSELISEISIPGTITPIYGSMVRATQLQGFADPMEGHSRDLGAGGATVSEGTIYKGGLLVHNGKLIGTSYVYYDAGLGAAVSHWTSGLTLPTAGDFKGLYKVGALNPGYVAGYMCAIPAAWQSALGGPVLTGAGALAIIARSSLGPSLHAFDPDLLVGAVATSYPATPLVYYDLAHPTLGTWDNQAVEDHFYNMACMFGGAVFPSGTDTVLVFGNIGHGVPHYGNASATNPPPAGSVYDPYSQNYAPHAWPYVNQAWAYDAKDLAKVKAGTTNPATGLPWQPWDVRPYALFDLSAACPVSDAGAFGAGLNGAAYDSATQRIYVPQDGAEAYISGAFNRNPLIRVFEVGF